MQAQTLQAEVRERSGKGPARQLRASGLIPAIIYGPGTEPVKLAVSPAGIEKALTGDFGRNQTLDVHYGDETRLALVKDLATDPVSRQLLHVDLYAIAEDRLVETVVPFETRGRALGVQKGGRLRKLFRELPVRAFPQNVPASIVLDVASMDINEEVKVEDLPLPEGVEVTYPAGRRVLFLEYKEAKVEVADDAAKS